MSEIKVTFAELQNASASIAATAKQMNQSLEDLKQALAPMVATWNGQAMVDYQAKQRQWDSAAADMNTVLAQISGAVSNAHDSYRATESANAARFA